MRRSRSFLLGALMVAGLLIGPGAGVAAAQPSGVIATTGWDCSPHGSGSNSLNTTLSAALIFENNMSKSSITCLFPSGGIDSTSLFSGVEFGGYCYYNVGLVGVQFRHRIFAVRPNGSASLLCWDGYFVCMQGASAPQAAQCATATVAPKSRRSVT